jgi:hypothetical protein
MAWFKVNQKSTIGGKRRESGALSFIIHVLASYPFRCWKMLH